MDSSPAIEVLDLQRAFDEKPTRLEIRLPAPALAVLLPAGMLPATWAWRLNAAKEN